MGRVKRAGQWMVGVGVGLILELSVGEVWLLAMILFGKKDPF